MPNLHIAYAVAAVVLGVCSIDAAWVLTRATAERRTRIEISVAMYITIACLILCIVCAVMAGRGS